MEALGISCCANSQFVTLFADGDRNNGTEQVVFDTKQAEKIYYIRDVTEVAPTTTLLATEALNTGGSVGNINNSVDKNPGTFADINPDEFDEITVRCNFQSAATRHVGVLYAQQSTTGSGNQLTVTARDAALAVIKSQLIFQTGASGNDTSKKLLDFGTLVGVQYVDINWDCGTNQTNLSLYEAYDLDEGLGASDMNIQVQNTITGTWHTVDSFAKVLPSTVELLETKTVFQPNSSLTRIQLVNTGKWNGSVGAILVNPKFT